MANFCVNCGKELDPDSTTCIYCGTVITEQIHEEGEFELKSIKYTCIAFIISSVLFTFVFYPLFYEYKPEYAVPNAILGSLIMSFYFAIMVLSFSQLLKFGTFFKIFIVTFWILSTIIFLGFFFLLPLSNPFSRIINSLGFGILLGFVATFFITLIYWAEEHQR